MVHADTLGKYNLSDDEYKHLREGCLAIAEDTIISSAKLKKTTATISVELCLQDDVGAYLDECGYSVFGKTHNQFFVGWGESKHTSFYGKNSDDKK